MDILKRNNVSVSGSGQSVIMFAHGFGCYQNMWRFITGSFEKDYKIILFDHVGAGQSDLAAYDELKYSKLDGYAADILEIINELELNEVIFVGHSVSAIMGMIAAKIAPQFFQKLILVSPSPSYINDRDYIADLAKMRLMNFWNLLMSITWVGP